MPGDDVANVARMADEKVKGPASYFPSIEKNYGMSIAHWKALLDAIPGAKHSEMVAMLKNDHSMGHGHANAIVAHYRSEHRL
jgi:predicted nuclease of restriction endonuclease-like RecB superfamily